MPRTTCRVVVDNDWAGDPDGLVALAHHLLSPGNRVVAVTTSFLSPVFGSPQAHPSHGSALARELVALVGLDPSQVPVHDGADCALEAAARPASEAARAIVREARTEDALPLYLVCGGPLTNVAEALRTAPDIAGRLTLVWVGGTLSEDGPGRRSEYNRDTDPLAAREVLGTAGLRIVQFPLETYRRYTYSLAELEHDLGTAGAVGAWLWRRFVELPLPAGMHPGPVWPLGDSPPVLVTALGLDVDTLTDGAAEASRSRVVCSHVDTRLLFGDMLARFRAARAADGALSPLL